MMDSLSAPLRVSAGIHGSGNTILRHEVEGLGLMALLEQQALMQICLPGVSIFYASYSMRSQIRLIGCEFAV